MEILEIPTTKGNKQHYVYNCKDFPYSSLRLLPTCKSKRYVYYNISSSFDIETTTIEPKQVDGKYIYNPYGFMYQWQFCISKNFNEKFVCFGRTWEEFQYFLRRLKGVLKLNKYQKLVVYVHNLSYEFQFMKEFIKIESIFAKEKRKLMKLFCNDGFEFRCSYFLSNMNLIKFCENSKLCSHFKLVDEYDYKKIRTPKTPLTLTEKQYCFNDVYGLCECIDTMLLDDTIATIPLTNTGYVRREYRQVMKTNKNRQNFESTRLNSEQYQLLTDSFRGGNTHANRFMANTIVKNVYSDDISSSYPTCIMMNDYPISKFMWATIDTQEKLDYYTQNFCCVMSITFKNIIAKQGNVIPYIDIAHCKEHLNIVNDNGRVLMADLITISITNIDLDIIRETYNFDGFIINKFMYAKKGKLPNELRKKLMDFFEAKTLLKGIEGKEYEYMKSKNRLNSTYGMMVTALVHLDINYDSQTMEWHEAHGDIEGSLNQFYKSRNNFLCYQWGVFVTANARRRLQNMLNVVGSDVIYCDTDSIKFVNEKHIKEFNELNSRLQYEAENNDIPAYVDRHEKDGSTKRFYLGTWDNDGNYKLFKTLGAKKYCFHKDKHGSDYFEVTVSGMSKKKGSKRVGNINNFNIGKTFHDVGRTVSWYNDEQIHKITINGDTFTTASNIGICDSTYTLGVTNEYWSLIANNNDLYI